MGILVLAGRVDLEGPLSPAYAGRMPQTSILIGGQRLIMAVGGALRAAIRAGNWVSAARESRRRARALADLNASGGIRGSSQMDSLWNRGFDQPFGPGAAMVGRAPRGADVIGNEATGARFVPGFQSSRMQAPYEGVRVWPRGTRSFFGLTGDMPAGNVAGPFMGRGMPDFRYRVDGTNPAIPRAFGGTFDWPAGGAVSPPAPRPSRFFFDDFEISNPQFAMGERMPQWYQDEIMRGWR